MASRPVGDAGKGGSHPPQGVVVGEDGKAKEIDTEELDEALLAGVVDQKQYELAKKAAGDVATFYNSNKELLEQKLYDYLKFFE